MMNRLNPSHATVQSSVVATHLPMFGRVSSNREYQTILGDINRHFLVSRTPPQKFCYVFDNSPELWRRAGIVKHIVFAKLTSAMRGADLFFLYKKTSDTDIAVNDLRSVLPPSKYKVEPKVISGNMVLIRVSATKSGIAPFSSDRALPQPT